jgi:hypothetical protein
MSYEEEQFIEACVHNDLNTLSRLVAQDKDLLTYTKDNVSYFMVVYMNFHGI